MNHSGEVQTATDAPLDLAGVTFRVMPMPEKPLDPAFEQLGLTPFDPDVWDSWAD